MISIPIVANSLTDENMQQWADALKAAKADRVFVFFHANVLSTEEYLNSQIDLFKKFKVLLHDLGIEAGIWVNDFSQPPTEGSRIGKYVKIQGLFIRSSSDFCPLDSRFREDFCEYLRKIALAAPDLIMLDDDYRLSVRNYPLGCFCKLHRRAFAKEYGMALPKTTIFKKVYCSKPNKVRDAWLSVSGKSLENFARALRKTVDSVDPTIRLGCCMCLDTLDMEGTDSLKLAKILAGNTRPFFRCSGAPYWQTHTVWGDTREVAEYTRAQVSWYREDDVEIFSEGDAFPRPRYNTPASHLECYDAYLKANGDCDILKYIFDYWNELGYEKGYIDLHLHNYDNIAKIAAAFDKKRQTGIEIFEVQNKMSSYDLSGIFPPHKDILGAPPKSGIALMFDGIIRHPVNKVTSVIQKLFLAQTESFSRAQRMLSNGIPSTYYQSDNAVICFGENARYLPTEYLNRGIILDCVAAKILSERGVDVGYVSSQRAYPANEVWEDHIDKQLNAAPFLYSLTTKPDAKMISSYSPADTTASYLYTNAEGQRFFVLGVNANGIPLAGNNDYFWTYARAKSIVKMAEAISAKPLVAFCTDCPNAAMLTSVGDDGQYAVGIFNFFADPIVNAEVQLFTQPHKMELINVDGSASGNTVKLNYIPSYGFAAFTFYAD